MPTQAHQFTVGIKTMPTQVHAFTGGIKTLPTQANQSIGGITNPKHRCINLLVVSNNTNTGASIYWRLQSKTNTGA
jgi:hypothetical protein